MIGALDRWAARIVSVLARLNRAQLSVLLLAGLLIRLAAAPAWGTQDVEWWKAWGGYAATHGTTSSYGAPDAAILAEWKAGKSFQELLASTQTVIAFQPHAYWRTEYKLGQPPVYIYALLASTTAYQWFSPGLANDRRFNVALNLLPIAASAMLAWLVALTAGAASGAAAGRLCGVTYWLNPLVILNAPVQGYQDPLCAMFAVASMAALFHRRLTLAAIALTLAMLTKPQGILVAPVLIGVALMEYGWRAWMKAAAAAFVTGVAVALPFLLESRLLSVIVGVLSIGEYSQDLTRESLNLWWPAQYAYNASRAIDAGAVSSFSAIAGGQYCWSCAVPIATFSEQFGFPIDRVGLLLLATFTAINLYALRRVLPDNRAAIVGAAAVQVYAYFVLRVGVQVNHYFLMIPLLTMTLLPAPRAVLLYAWICGIFLAQDLLFYGLGRDFNRGVELLSRVPAGGLTVVLALLNVATFAVISARQIRSGRILAQSPP